MADSPEPQRPQGEDGTVEARESRPIPPAEQDSVKLYDILFRHLGSENVGFTIHELPGKIRDTPWPTLLEAPALATVGLGIQMRTILRKFGMD